MFLYIKSGPQLLKWSTPEPNPACAIELLRFQLRDDKIRVLALITEKPGRIEMFDDLPPEDAA